MDDLFDDLEFLGLQDPAPEVREKIEVLKNFRNDLETVNGEMLVTLLNNFSAAQPEVLERLDSLYEQMGEDLKKLRVKLFDKEENA